MCNKLEHYQYIVDCNKHGESIQSKYHDLKIGRYGSCKLCWWETKYVDKIKSKSENFVRFLEPVFGNKQKVKAECKIHGIYENTVNKIIQAKKSAGCKQCWNELNIKNSFKNKTEKNCTKCNKTKPIDEFHTYIRKNGRECISGPCISCENERNKEFSVKYRKTENYINSQKKYKQTDKYKLFVKERGLRKLKIKYIDIYLHKCKCCKSMFYNKEKILKYKLCLKCNTDENQIKFYNKYKHQLKDCICCDCGKLYKGKTDNSRCDNCRDKADKEYNRQYNRQYKKRYGRTHKDRAKYFGCYYEKVDKVKVFERDKYICKECGIKCNPNQHYNKRDYPTLGHIVPLSLKGSHTYTNVQCECRNCNELKSNKIYNQQLTIFYDALP